MCLWWATVEWITSHRYQIFRDHVSQGWFTKKKSNGFFITSATGPMRVLAWTHTAQSQQCRNELSSSSHASSRWGQLLLLSKIISLWPSILNPYSSIIVSISEKGGTWVMDRMVIWEVLCCWFVRGARAPPVQRDRCWLIYAVVQKETLIWKAISGYLRVLLRSKVLPRRLAGSRPHGIKILSYEFCILTLCVLGSGLELATKLERPKKKKPQPKSRNAVVISDWLFSSSKYVLRNAWSCAGLQREGSSLHHGQGCQEGQRGGFSPNFALAPKTASSFFLFFLWLGLRDCLHGIWIDSGKNFSLCDIIICLIQAKAWSGTMLVHSSSDW